ncbi:MAG TPA: pyridoxal phosphate-dependent aminotransferase family protein [Bacteroidia bacterium]|nr:pyridoxal phosphate-dependent aminotransferase family protein [Bacteroidia bacterium]
MKDNFLQKHLSIRKEQGLYRRLVSENNLVDFSSNDYLGFSRSKELFDKICLEVEHVSRKYGMKIGSTGSRLLTGNSQYVEVLEKNIADYHKAEAGLIFNSGYDANLGLLSSVPKKGDIVLYDELSHASIYDGIRLSKASSFPFKHNDLNHLEERLQFFDRNNTTANYFVVVESVYSMDGDFAPLYEIALLCEKYNANLVVDEAHATGVFGKKGEGRVVETHLQDKVFARIHTFGKALGCHGAIVLGSNLLRNYLINFSRPFIYTTALSSHELASIKSAYELLNNSNHIILNINNLISLFNLIIDKKNINLITKSKSLIQCISASGNNSARVLAELIQKDGFDVRAILSPTVPKGKERIRICLHTFNTQQEIEQLFVSLQTHMPTMEKSNLKAI